MRRSFGTYSKPIAGHGSSVARKRRPSWLLRRPRVAEHAATANASFRMSSVVAPTELRPSPRKHPASCLNGLRNLAYAIPALMRVGFRPHQSRSSADRESITPSKWCLLPIPPHPPRTSVQPYQKHLCGSESNCRLLKPLSGATYRVDYCRQPQLSSPTLRLEPIVRLALPTQ